MRYVVLVLALLSLSCVARWTPAEKKMALADGFCLELKVAEIGGSVGHCGDTEE